MQLERNGKKIEISEQQFEEYLKIQSEGKYNMFSPFARELSSMDREQWRAIITNYDKLMKRYRDTYDKYF